MATIERDKRNRAGFTVKPLICGEDEEVTQDRSRWAKELEEHCRYLYHDEEETEAKHK